MSGDDRLTPDEVLDPVRLMGDIITDPASNRWSNVGAKYRYDGITKDGLMEPWIGLTWLNGPWSNLGPFATRSLEYQWTKKPPEIFFWAPCYPETKWAKELWLARPTVCFWYKRVHHADPNPNPKKKKKGQRQQSMWPTMLVYMGKRKRMFGEIFSEYGTIMEVKL